MLQQMNRIKIYSSLWNSFWKGKHKMTPPAPRSTSLSTSCHGNVLKLRSRRQTCMFLSRSSNCKCACVCDGRLFLDLCLPTRNYSAVDETCRNATQLAELILSKTRSFDVMADSLAGNDVENLISSLLSHDLTPDQIVSLLVGRVWLMRLPEHLLQVLDHLQSNGLAKTLTLDLVAMLPYEMQSVEGLRHTVDTLETTIALFRGMGFSGKNLRRLLERSATNVFDLDWGRAEENWKQLHTLFSNQDSRTIVGKCPNILKIPWSETQAKFDYVHYKMGCDVKQIAESRVFSHSLEHIEDRHLFLSRSGLYKHVKLKDERTLNLNPSLSQMFDSSPTKFTANLGVLDIDQFTAFCAIRDLERQMEEGNLSDSDEEEESS